MVDLAKKKKECLQKVSRLAMFLFCFCIPSILCMEIFMALVLLQSVN